MSNNVKNKQRETEEREREREKKKGIQTNSERKNKCCSSHHVNLRREKEQETKEKMSL